MPGSGHLNHTLPVMDGLVSSLPEEILSGSFVYQLDESYFEVDSQPGNSASTGNSQSHGSSSWSPPLLNQSSAQLFAEGTGENDVFCSPPPILGLDQSLPVFAIDRSQLTTPQTAPPFIGDSVSQFPFPPAAHHSQRQRNYSEQQVFSHSDHYNSYINTIWSNDHQRDLSQHQVARPSEPVAHSSSYHIPVSMEHELLMYRRQHSAAAAQVASQPVVHLHVRAYSSRQYDNNPSQRMNQTFSGTGRADRNLRSLTYEVCAYCKSVDEEHYGHTKKNCHRLAALGPCRLCGATGVNNHTESHCPHQQPQQLELDPGFVTRSNDRMRDRQRLQSAERRELEQMMAHFESESKKTQPDSE